MHGILAIVDSVSDCGVRTKGNATPNSREASVMCFKFESSTAVVVVVAAAAKTRDGGRWDRCSRCPWSQDTRGEHRRIGCNCYTKWKRKREKEENTNTSQPHRTEQAESINQLGECKQHRYTCLPAHQNCNKKGQQKTK